jgi:hypothetical protein
VTRAIPWPTSFRTLPHAQPEHSEHAMLRGVAGCSCCSPFRSLGPGALRHSASGFFLPTTPYALGICPEVSSEQPFCFNSQQATGGGAARCGRRLSSALVRMILQVNAGLAASR